MSGMVELWSLAKPLPDHKVAVLVLNTGRDKHHRPEGVGGRGRAQHADGEHELPEHLG